MRWLQVLVLATLVGGTLSVLGGAAPAAQASAAATNCVEDFEYTLDAQGVTCRFAKRLIAGANDVGRARYDASDCARVNDSGGECQAYRTSFRQGSYRCTYRYYPWDYLSRTVCRHVDKPRRRWAVEESA